MESDGLVHAGAPVETLLRLAGHRSIANLAAPAVQALAGVPAVGVEASPTIQAGILVALVDVRLAESTHVPRSRAIAAEPIDPVDAAPIVLARLRGALVGVDLAPAARISFGALAGHIAADDHAGAVVQARIRVAEWVDVHLRLTVLATMGGIAEALVVAARVLQAGASIYAWILGTRGSVVLLAVLSRVPGRAPALVSLGAGGAGSMAHAWVVQTIVVRQSGEEIMIAAGTRGQGTHSKDHVLHRGVVNELEARPVEKASGEGVA